MPHRDDNEAARQRIASLERELEDTRRRAEVAEKAARVAQQAPKAQPARAKAARKEKKKRRREPAAASAPASDPRWPPGGMERHRRLVGAAAMVYAPAALLTVAGARGAEPPYGWLGIALLSHLVLTYGIGRVSGAPFPANGPLVLLLVSPMIAMGLVFGASDLFWGEMFAEGALRWIVRGVCAVAALAIGALVSGAWSADAASSEVSAD